MRLGLPRRPIFPGSRRWWKLFRLHCGVAIGARKMAMDQVTHGQARLSEFLLCEVREVDNRRPLRLSRGSGRARARIDTRRETLRARPHTSDPDDYREQSTG